MEKRAFLAYSFFRPSSVHGSSGAPTSLPRGVRQPSRRPNTVPSRPQDGFEGSKPAQDNLMTRQEGFTRAPDGPKRPSRKAPTSQKPSNTNGKSMIPPSRNFVSDGLFRPSDGPQETPNTPPKRSREAPRNPKSPPVESPQATKKAPTRPPKRAQEPFKKPQERPRGP